MPSPLPVLVVTGAGSGIGRAVAVRLASTRSERLVLVGRRSAALAETAQLLGSRHRPLVVSADLSSPAGAARLADSIGNTPVVGIAMAAGGVAPESGLEGLDGVAADFLAEWQLNTMTAVLTVAAVRGNLADNARIVAVGSIAAQRGGGAYGAAKAALTPWIRDLARALGPRGITANVVAPGYTEDTEFFGEAISPSRRDRLVAETMTRRATTPDHVADVIATLLSPTTGQITAQVIQINGGAAMGS